MRTVVDHPEKTKWRQSIKLSANDGFGLGKVG